MPYSKYDEKPITNKPGKTGKHERDDQPSLFDNPTTDVGGVQLGGTGQPGNGYGNQRGYGAGSPVHDGNERPGSVEPSGTKPGGSGISNPGNKSGKDTGRPSGRSDSGATPNKNDGKFGLGTITNEKVESLKVIRTNKTEVAITGGYDDYAPEIKIEGSRPHPMQLFESTAMSSVSLPKTNYSLTLPQPINNRINLIYPLQGNPGTKTKVTWVKHERL